MRLAILTVSPVMGIKLDIRPVITAQQLAADHAWVEVSRMNCFHHWHLEGLNYGCWFYPFTRGSNLWVNVGRSLRLLDHEEATQRFRLRGPQSDRSWCSAARRRGYDSIQVARYHDQPELVICYGGCMSGPIATVCLPDTVLCFLEIEPASRHCRRACFLSC